MQDTWFNRIDDYLLNRLNKTEEQAFEIEMSKNQALATAVQQQQKIIEGIESYGRDAFKTYLKEIHQDVIETSKTSPLLPAKKNNFRKIICWTIAAGMLLLSIFWFLKPKNNEIEKLYAQHYVPYDLKVQSRTGDTLTLWIEAKALYTKKTYAKALPLFKSLLEKQPTNILAQLGAGICLLEINEPVKAIRYFDRIINSNDLLYKDQAQWYKGMALLKLKDVEAAKAIFESLASTPSADHHKAAKEILQQLQQ
ncbi:MAG: tol-pal system YbgF family protein [Saprospiraceae bacterium]